MTTYKGCNRNCKDLYDIDDLEKNNRKLMAKTFAQLIKNARRSRRVSQEACAAAANISSKYYGAIERSEKTPGIVVACKIAAALKIPPCKIFSIDYCPHMNSDLSKELRKLLSGIDDEKKLEKAVKIIKILLEQS